MAEDERDDATQTLTTDGTRGSTEDMQEEEEEEAAGARKLRLTVQVLMVLGASLGHLGLVVVVAWPNPAAADLRRHNTTLYGTTLTLTPWQVDMLGSMVSVGNVPGVWLWGWLVARVGRRRAMMLLVAPYTLGWCLVALASSPVVMLAGRVVHGVCVGATFVSASTYIIELPDPSIRGAAANLPNLALSFGFIITAALGLVLRWYEIAVVGEAIIVLQTAVMFFLPESPSFLALKGREDQARRILMKLRGPYGKVEEELIRLREENEDKVKESLFTVIRDTHILKSLGIVFVLFFVQNFCGMMVFYVNMTRIFLEAGTVMSEDAATMVVFLVQAAGTVLACLYLDSFGRRVCLVASLAAMTVCLAVMGAYHHYRNATHTGNTTLTNNSTRLSPDEIMDDWSTDGPAFTWVPLACLMLYMFAASVGAGPVPAILNAEYFPAAVRAQLSGLGMVVGSGINFAALQLFTPMQLALTTAGLYWFYAFVSVFGIVFTLTCVRETKGRPVA